MAKFTTYMLGILFAGLVTLAFTDAGHAFGMDEESVAISRLISDRFR
jgi:hypothetical protein